MSTEIPNFTNIGGEQTFEPFNPTNATLGLPIDQSRDQENNVLGLPIEDNPVSDALAGFARAWGIPNAADPTNPYNDPNFAGNTMEKNAADFMADINGENGAAAQLARLMSVTFGGATIGKGAISSIDDIVTKTTDDIARAASGSSVPTAGNIATNTKTVSQTTSWIKGLIPATKAGKATAIAGGILAAVGTYPFAGFIKEEALQTLGFATNNALRNGDLDGAQRAIEDQADILDPNVWTKIIAAVPFANVLQELKSFYDAAQNKLETDANQLMQLKLQQIENNQRLMEQSQFGTGTGQGSTTTETFNQIFNRQFNDTFSSNFNELRQEGFDQADAADRAAFQRETEQSAADREVELRRRDEDTAFFNRIAEQQDERTRQQLADKANSYLRTQSRLRQADSAQMRKDKAFLREMNDKANAEERVRVADFWREYNKLEDKRRADLSFEEYLKKRKSNLGFGIVG